MVSRTVFLSSRFYEVLLLALSWAIFASVATVMVVHDSEDALEKVFNMIFRTMVIGFPFVMLVNYYSQDKNKILTIDEENGVVEFQNERYAVQFSLSDIENIRSYWCYLFPDLGFYEINIKGKEPIKMSFFVPINKLMKYAKDRDVYKKEGRMLPIMN